MQITPRKTAKERLCQVILSKFTMKCKNWLQRLWGSIEKTTSEVFSSNKCASYNLHPLFCLLGSRLLSTSSLLADVHVRNNNIGYYFRLLGGPRVLHVVQICRSLLVEVWNLGYYFCLSGGPRAGPGWLGGLLPRCGPDCGISQSVLATCCKLLHMFCMMFYLVAFSEVWTQLWC